jgi:Tc toxin complex TcA C-terminal TcB-binding domain/Neuraminidase-like domain
MKSLPKISLLAHVRGVVRQAGGWDDGLTVRAYGLHLRDADPIGQPADVDPEGGYEITYLWQETPTADLQIRVYDENDQELARSETRFNASADETIDVIVPPPSEGDGSEYERYVADLTPRLDGLRFDQLTENAKHHDLSFLSGDTGIPKETIGWLRDAHRLERADLPADVFYAWLRKGLPGDPDLLWSTPPAQLVGALRSAIDEGIVPQALSKDFDGLAKRIRDKALQYHVRATPEGQPASLGDVLRTMPCRLTAAKQKRVLEAVLEVPVDDPDFGKRLGAAKLSENEAHRVEQTVRLAQLTGFNYPALIALQPAVAGDDDASLRGLATLAPEDWLDVAYTHGVPAGSTLAPYEYATRLQTRVEESHPAATLGERLQRGSLKFDHPGIDDARDFLVRNPAFDIVGADLDPLLEGGKVTPDGVAALRALRGLKRLGTSWSETAVLHAHGFGSVGDVANAVPEVFALRIADDIPSDRADQIHASACLARDAAIAVMVASSPHFAPVNSPGPADGAIDPSTLGDGDTLRKLFGDLDDCGCQECRSLTGPLSYFVELVDSARGKPAMWAQVMRRRPDLVDLELSCPNAEQEMTYIDRVLETLENAVALPLPVSVPKGQTAAAVLGATPLDDSIYQVLKTTCLSIADRSALKAVKETIPLLPAEATAWIVRDGGKRWTLHQVTESLTLTKPGAPPTVLALTGARPSAIAAELDSGQISAELKSGFAEALVTDRLSLFAPSVVTVEAGLRWRLDYRVGVRIEIDIIGANGMLRIEAEDGTVIAAGLRPSNLLVDMADRLDRNAVDGPIVPIIGPLLPVTVTVEAQGHRWTVTSGPRSADLVFRPEALTLVSLCYQSSASTSADVIALPEYRNPVAYDNAHVGGARFPWTLPFDLPVTEVRAYLDRARTSRLELMETVDPEGRLTSEPVARELIGLSSSEADLIRANPGSAAERWQQWGLEVSGGRTTVRDTSIDKDVTDTPFNVLGRASILVQQSGLTWPDLLAIVDTDFVRSAGSLKVTPPDECQLSRVRVPVKAGHLDRIHRFTRIWRALGWRIDELDVAIRKQSLQLVRLAAVERLRRRLELPVDELLSWWGRLGGRTYRSYDDGTVEVTPVFERVFQNPALGSDAERPLRLSADRQKLVVAGAGPAPTVSANLTPIAAALGVAETDLLALVGLADGEVPDTLDLATLSTLHAVAGVARALGLSLEDYRRARRLTRLNPLASPAEAVRFVDAVDFVQASGFTVEELAFLLRDEAAGGSALPLDDQRVQNILTRIAELPQDPPPLGGGPAPAASGSTRADRVVALLASELTTDASLLSALIRGQEQGPMLVYPGTTRPAIEAFLEIALPAAGLPIQAPKAEIVLRRLQKSALIWERLKITTVDLRWMTYPMRVLDPNALPDQQLGPDETTPGFDAWRGLAALCIFRARLHHADELLAGYVEKLAENPPDLVGARALLGQALHVDGPDVDGVFQDLGLGLAAADADHYADPGKLQQALAALTLAKRLASPWTQLTLLATPDPDATAATAARRLVTTKFGAEQWRELVKPIADRLRERQRDALVGHLVARNSLRDADDLYDYFLIDPQRAPCFMTSRIVEATGAMQQLWERSSSGFEPGIVLTPTERDRLPYLLDRRIRDVQLNIFLRPWTWLYPELRDDKTQPFLNFEAAFTQGEPSTEIARDALLGYLEDLVELDQMKILALHEHVPPPDSGAPPALYVIGRTADKPFQYYLQSCTNFGIPEAMRWTGWERLDLDIPGDHVMPFVFEGNLHIAWPTITKTGGAGGDQDGAPLEIHLAWSRRTRDGWTKRKVSRDPIPNSPQLLPGRSESDGLAFRVFRRPPTAADWPDPTAWHLPSLRSLTVEDVAIRCFAGVPAQLPPVPSQTTKLSPPQYLSFPDVTAKTTYSVTVLVYKRFVPNGNDSGRYALAHGVDVTLTFDSPQETVELGQTVNGFLNALLFHNVNTAPVKFIITATEPFLNSTAQSDKVSIREYASFVIASCTLVMPVNEDPPALPLIPEGIPIAMSSYGDFVFSTGRDVASGFAPDAITSQDLLDGTVSSRGGYLEASPPADVSFTMSPDGFGSKPPVLFDHTPGRFEAVAPRPPSARGEIWHYTDDAARYYIYAPSDASLGAPGRGLTSRRDQGHARFVDPLAGDGAQLALPTKPSILVLSDRLGIAPFLRVAATVSLSALYAPDLQAATDGGTTFTSRFSGAYDVDPSSILTQGVSFDHRSPLSVYAWELWLHTRMRTWQRFAKAGRYDEGLDELRYLWDPDGSDAGWKLVPFQKVATGESIRDVLQWLAAPEGHEDAIAAFRQQLLAWREDPYQPHAVARLRPVAYMWRTALDCGEMLIGSGDQLQLGPVTRVGLEKAARQYVRAARIFGRRPAYSRPQAEAEVLTYRDLVARQGDYSYGWERIFDQPGMSRPIAASNGTHASPSPRTVGSLYFCVPPDTTLLDYWDRIDRRLWNLRHCRDLDGNPLELPLYDPPLDPELLIRARAAGLDINAVLGQAPTRPPRWRFSAVLARALQLAGSDLVSLDDTYLGAHEKLDADQLALMQSTHSIELLKLGTQIKDEQIRAAEQSIKALTQARNNAGERWQHYQRLLGKQDLTLPPVGTRTDRLAAPVHQAPSGPLVPVDASLALLQTEVQQLELNGLAHLLSGVVFAHQLAAAIAYGVGTYPLAAPVASAVGSSVSAVGSAIGTLASDFTHVGSILATVAGYERRRADWVLNSNGAAGELDHLGEQILTEQIQLGVHQLERTSQQRQLDQAIEQDEYIRLEKFTNIDMRRQMLEQARELRYVHFQLAQELKLEVEAAYKFELGEDPPPSDLEGPLVAAPDRDLLLGRRLTHELRRIEAAYNDRRAETRHEIVKNVSLRKVAPAELIKLRATGSCAFSITELDYDLDAPGQWDRRFKAIRGYVHCVTGRNEGVNCILTKTTSRTRSTSDRSAAAALPPDPHADCSIFISSGKGDSGRFELNLRDDLLLVGEHQGAISDWSLEVASPFPGYDTDTIADVVLEVMYTAREATDDSRTKAITQLTDALKDTAGAPLALLVSVRHDLSNEWQRLADASRQHLSKSTVTLPLGKDMFPLGFQPPEWTIEITRVELYLKLTPVTDPDAFAADELNWTVTGPSAPQWSGGTLAGLDPPSSRAFTATARPAGAGGGAAPKGDAPGDWALEISRPGPAGDEAVEFGALKDLLVVCHYAVHGSAPEPHP